MSISSSGSAARAARPRRARGGPGVLAPVVLAASLAVHGARPSQPAAELPGRVPAVVTSACVVVDPSRSTYDYATGTTLPGRVLRVEVRRPAGRRRSLPTILFAPGYDATPGTYARLLDAWARAGFAVISPTFPDTSPAAVARARRGDPEDDLVNQPADLAFVARRAVAASGSPDRECPALDGLVDPRELGLAGQSDGGDTVAMLAYDRAAPYAGLDRGLGVRAVAVLSGAEVGPGPFEAVTGDPALLVVQSATDRCNPPQESVELYDAIVQRDRWFLELREAAHLPPYDGADPAAFSAVTRVTTRFFLLELRGASPRAGFLAFGDAEPGVARLTTGPDAPPLGALAPSVAACAAR